MKTCLDCIPCFFDQALRAGRMATSDERLHKRILDDLGRELESISLDATPPEIGERIYRRVREITGAADPYAEVKRQGTEQALRLYPSLKERIDSAPDRLFEAVKTAIAGNVIDFGPGDCRSNGETDQAVEETLRQPFGVCDYDQFVEALSAAEWVLYIGDNAGETVFDRLLIERLGKPVTYAVRERPIINDATVSDAEAAGLSEVARIVSSGCGAPGTIRCRCSGEFLGLLDSAPMVIAKGQGNYESLSQERRRMFFLLKVKCRLIARHLGIPRGSLVLKAGDGEEPDR